MQLNNQQKKFLRNLAHPLKPLVMIGEQGVTENIITEIDNSISHHELIKVRVSVGDRVARDKVIDNIAKKLDITLVQRIGNIAVCYRARPNNYKAGKSTKLESIKLPK